jgi:hypothetical protein
MTTATANSDLAALLAAPFPESQVRWKPQAISGNRALAVAYVSARAIMERLDRVLGLGGWRDEYQFSPDGNVHCRLSIKVDGEWVTREDVGAPSEQPDEGDRLKAAVSDSLKRAAVKFGLARYLYGLPRVWADYDPQKKRFTRMPQLPAWARPGNGGGKNGSAVLNGGEGPDPA